MALEQLARQLRPKPYQPEEPSSPTTCLVVRKDSKGAWVVPLGEDTRHPIGPCDVGDLTVAKGNIVLLIFTQERPWITAVSAR